MNKFNQAQEAVFFSAPGYAKDGLAYLLTAQKLDPENKDIILSLIEFYLQAPGIAGGDEDEAKNLADALFEKDAIFGTIALAKILAYDDSYDEAIKLIDKQLHAFPENSQLHSQKAFLLMDSDKPAQAIEALARSITLIKEEAEKYENIYQIGRLAAVYQLKAELGKSALQQYLAYYQGSDNRRLKWANLRLAQIYMQANDINDAKAIIASLQDQAHPQKRFRKELKSVEKTISKLDS